MKKPILIILLVSVFVMNVTAQISEMTGNWILETDYVIENNAPIDIEKVDKFVSITFYSDGFAKVVFGDNIPTAVIFEVIDNQLIIQPPKGNATYIELFCVEDNEYQFCYFTGGTLGSYADIYLVIGRMKKINSN